MSNPLSNITQALSKRLAEQHDLVTREEFDAQARLLAASEAKIQELEQLIEALEQKLDSQAPT